MLSAIIRFSIRNKLIVLLFTALILGFGFYSLSKIAIGATPDITNNQIQVITTSENLSTQDMEQFITYPVELQMANLPGVKEIRSVSKFGLSVVTVVFEDDLGTYLPRQLIAEKIQSAAEQIPEGFGTPQMGPITTGLGEIYQYTLDTKPGYEDQYSAMDLRTIQDWIVKRQLSGIPGVVEINTWGGYLKQYEVAIDNNQLNAMGITVTQVMDALEKNNSIAGGGYIEQSNQAYFIRGEGLAQSLDEIGDIVVANKNGTPVYVKDIATLGYGHATRFGAITGNGEGEKVLGQIMMLKGAGTKKVIDAVNERVAEISKSLPEGVYINPFLDRSDLIGRTTFTIAENLILGCLIVIFVVVLLLGNIRSGLVVASVIPLCLMFALSLMYIFGVDANLMSLGAIDFGIIIDGAVIIVEFTAFQLASRQIDPAVTDRKQLRAIKNQTTLESASKMMNSAVFGQLIILIVFIPILSLSGVEGKMFRPMALTFCFALIGAMILCFTYVPVASSLFLKAGGNTTNKLSRKLISWLNRAYSPLIEGAMKAKRLVILSAAVLLGIATFIFVNMGGEFVPTLDEGDFVIQPVLKTGTSLSETIKITTKMEQILIDQFPEVNQVVSKIGAAEVPTDPMSMEESDVNVTLKPKSEWVNADTKDELAEKVKEALSVIPGLELEFTQPIEMRFNELITGVRADIAIKVFGEDLDILSEKANEISNLIQNVEGAADITVEKVTGLPQIMVDYNRAKIARYGLNIADINKLITMGFAGISQGSIFEGEKRFDLVVRFDENSRENIEDLQNLFVDLPSGEKVPLQELATISYTKGAAKISRDDTQRRIVVGVNVRNRDLQSVVDEIMLKVNKNIILPVGYTIDYGGQYENLQNASARLKVAVPIALLLIFIMLYFAFKSVKEALIIFSAIPLSAVGGVLFLWIRDMPFSISAGVGFIALFGIAVLNGIVLIEHYKELREQGMKNINEIVVKGAKDRLRAVLLTASAAALGFLPMAVSQGSGAEVQRPLATVVIGGLITATLLTLIVLPVLVSIFEHDTKKKFKKALRLKWLILPIPFVLFAEANAQEKVANFDDLRAIAIENNAALKAANLRTQALEKEVGSAFDFDKTEVYYHYDENNLAYNNQPIHVYGVQQSFAFPTVYFARARLNRSQFNLSESQEAMAKINFEKELAINYNELLWHEEQLSIYEKLDSIYKDFAHAASRKFELGESNYLEKITAKAKQKELETQRAQVFEHKRASMITLTNMAQAEDSLTFEFPPLTAMLIVQTAESVQAATQVYEAQGEAAVAESNLNKQALLPDLTASYFQGSNNGIDENLIGYQLGVRIPLFFNGKVSKIKAAKLRQEAAEQDLANYKIRIESQEAKLRAELTKYRKALEYYDNEGEELSQQLIKMGATSYKNGEIDFFEYIQTLENAYEIELAALKTLHDYNRVAIQLNYLTL